MTPNIDQLVATSGATETRIGWLLWFKVAESIVDQTIYERAFAESELPEEYAMSEIRPVDAFRRASKSVEQDVRGENKERMSLLCRDVASEKNLVRRHLVIETRDTAHRRLLYNQCAAVLTFNRETNQIETSIMEHQDFVVDAVLRFEHGFRRCLAGYDGQAKRRLIRNVLDDMAATSVKESGGVYLIPRAYEERLFQLITFIKALPDCSAHKMPVEDTKDARDMVREVVTQKATDMMAELRSALRQDKLSERNMQNMLIQAKSVRDQVTLYQRLLKETIGTLETDVEMLEAQMMAMLQAI